MFDGIFLLLNVIRVVCFTACRSATVTTFDTAEKLRQCTIINGSLEIQVGKGGIN